MQTYFGRYSKICQKMCSTCAAWQTGVMLLAVAVRLGSALHAGEEGAAP